MAMKMKYVDYTSPKQILAIPDHYVAFGYKHEKAIVGSTGIAVLVDGRYIVKAGTIYPSNDANAIGIVLNDYDVTDGDQMLAVVVHGFIKNAALPVLPTQEARQALTHVKFVDPVALAPISVRKNPNAVFVHRISNTDYSINATGAQPTVKISADDGVDFEVNISGIAPKFPDGYAAAAGFSDRTNGAVVLVEVPFDNTTLFDATKVKFDGAAVTTNDVVYIDGTWYLVIIKGLKSTDGVISGGATSFTLGYDTQTAKTYKWAYTGLSLEV